MNNRIILTGFADEIDPDLNRQISVIRKLGISHIEMRGVDGKSLVDYPLEKVREIRKRLDDQGIQLSGVGSPIGKIGITEDFAPHYERFQHTVEIAHIMGTRNIRMFSFYIPAGEAPEQYQDAVFERLDQFAMYARREDVVLLHENEKGIYGDVASRCLEIMQRFYGPHFQAVFDFANFVQVHQDTIRAYELLKPYIAYVHVKDALLTNAHVVPAGMGDGHVEEILSDLLQNGYEGYLSLEPHLADFTGRGSLDNLVEKRDKPLDGEEAFTLAYQALMTILKRIGVANIG